ncbi:MAG: hypothetical protein Nkreftii_003323 [Candidatus Nitrospira kreftii]|uniref:Uncharacterized protein n=1 Tax=Candidatus Nitrospira kreftii TaxID=2652173 RepID=A0A7S8J114_9BACT|nr:MAG: hypothetical protein Nkreftii_003323 [Candidatus Nitrospira kreftii]
MVLISVHPVKIGETNGYESQLYLEQECRALYDDEPEEHSSMNKEVSDAEHGDCI